MEKLLLSIFFIATNVHAVDWVNINSATQIDADSIDYVNIPLDQREAWIQFISNSGEKNKVHLIFDCKNLNILENDLIEYDKLGKAKRAIRPNLDWATTAPDTNIRYTLETVCSYPYL